MEFKDKLKQLRAEKKISQQALADQLFISRSVIAKWESGLDYPNQDSYDALISYFGVDPDYFRTEEPERIIIEKNQHIGLYRCILITIAVVLLFSTTILSTNWFTSVSSTDIQALEKQSAKYLGYAELKIITTSQRGDFLAALCVSPDGTWSMCVFERSRLFQNRWYANGGIQELSVGELTSWNYCNPQQGAILIFCGAELPEEIKWYSFTNDEITHICPVQKGYVLDVFIILEAANINSHPTPLDISKKPINH